MRWVLVFLLVIAGCILQTNTNDVPILIVDTAEHDEVGEQVEKIEVSVPELPTRTVTQKNNNLLSNYGLTEDNRLVFVGKDTAEWNYVYSDGKLVEIKGPEYILFA